ncbi:MAG: hypothetical protein IT211_13015 [Armatimonadetes bacterium]|nr:hypothetical protein [Armatimonadota bacterium]
MKTLLLVLLAILAFPLLLASRTLEVGQGAAYANLQAAAAAAQPGDTILFKAGTHAGGQYVEGLQGRADAWITILGEGEGAVIRGGSNAWQLTDPAYLRIVGISFGGQTGNGLNIDDGGTYDTPAHHLIVERCTWLDINATGNNDLFKMSGIDSFEVRDCTFQNGAAGGSMIDMVGCHQGSFLRNRFERGGSNCIQAKGGTSDIRIEGNTFIDGGARAINIGGSTGLQFFRPLGINYESARIAVYSNIFVGSDAPVAFVGTVNSEVVNNTIYLPQRWAARILQETTGATFLQCGDNAFRNNIVVIGNMAANPIINIGGNTRPATFAFANNLWFHAENGSWSGPNLPATESNGIIGRDPLLAAAPSDFALRTASPAIGAGLAVDQPTHDYKGRPFLPNRSIGAVEGGTSTTAVGAEHEPQSELQCQAISTPDQVAADIRLSRAGRVELSLHDVRGETIWQHHTDLPSGHTRLQLPIAEAPSGFYLLIVRLGSRVVVKQVVR